MVTQEVTYYPDSFNVKEYKEYHNGELNVHSKYDERNNKVYLYLAYENLQWERRFTQDSTNNNGRIIYYKDNKGNYKLVQDGLLYKVSKDGLAYDITITEDTQLENVFIKSHGKLNAKGIRDYANMYCLFYDEKLPNGDHIRYNKQYFNEIYYEYHQNGKYTGERKIISFDKLMSLTQFKDFLVEQRVCPVSKTYFGNRYENISSKSLFISD